MQINLLKAKSEFRKKGVTLLTDKKKSGGGGSWSFASEDNLIKTIQAPLTEVGLEYIATLKAMPELNINIVVGTLYHIESGEYIESSKVLQTPTPKKDRNGNLLYLDAEIEAGKQFGYWSRILAIRLLGLSDVAPEEMDKYKQSDLTSIEYDTLKEMKVIQQNIDLLDADSIEKAVKNMRNLYAYEVEETKKDLLKAYAEELKEALDEINQSN